MLTELIWTLQAIYPMSKILFPILFCLTLNLHAQQIDSTWINGTKILADGYYKADKSTFTNLLVMDYLDSSNFYFVNPELQIPLNGLETALIRENYNGNKFLTLTFKKALHSKWAELTASQIGKNLVLMVDNQLVQGSQVNAEIPNGMSAINRDGLTEIQLNELLSLITERSK